MKSFIPWLLACCLVVSCASGPARNKAELESLRRSANRGNVSAQYELGEFLMKLKNPTEANEWFRKAAERGVVEAQYRLAKNYEKGEGVPEDLVEAYAWYAVAAENGSLMAMNGKERLARYLSRADLEEANRKAFQYATKIPSRKK